MILKILVVRLKKTGRSKVYERLVFKVRLVGLRFTNDWYLKLDWTFLFLRPTSRKRANDRSFKRF